MNRDWSWLLNGKSTTGLLQAKPWQGFLGPALLAINTQPPRPVRPDARPATSHSPATGHRPASRSAPRRPLRLPAARRCRSDLRDHGPDRRASWASTAACSRLPRVASGWALRRHRRVDTRWRRSRQPRPANTGRQRLRQTGSHRAPGVPRMLVKLSRESMLIRHRQAPVPVSACVSAGNQARSRVWATATPARGDPRANSARSARRAVVFALLRADLPRWPRSADIAATVTAATTPATASAQASSRRTSCARPRCCRQANGNRPCWSQFDGRPLYFISSPAAASASDHAAAAGALARSIAVLIDQTPVPMAQQNGPVGRG